MLLKSLSCKSTWTHFICSMLVTPPSLRLRWKAAGFILPLSIFFPGGILLAQNVCDSVFTIRIRMQAFFLNDSRFSSVCVCQCFLLVRVVFSRLLSRGRHTHDSTLSESKPNFFFELYETHLSSHRNFHALSNRIYLRLHYYSKVFFSRAGLVVS